MSVITAKNGIPYSCNLNGSSYSCPLLGLFGYATERSLKLAINKKIKK